ncbi:MAG: winged helix-turn-helix domain-containing protein [Polyangiaceae bacterium]|nr:winged helix-turn-helix domain-containing protein [Polyangiaceae bacterium]
MQTTPKKVLTLAAVRAGKVRVDPVNQLILEALGLRKEGCSTQELATTIKLTPRATRTRLVKLIADGLVLEIGSGPQDPKRRYFLAQL